MSGADAAMTMKDECARRLARLRETLAAMGLDGALLVQANDVFYY